MLKLVLSSLDGLSDAVKELYEKNGDQYALKLDDPAFDGLKKKVDEFRSNNRGLHKEVEDLRALKEKVGGLDPEKYKEMQTIIARLEQAEDAQLLKDGKFDEVIERRTKAMQAEYEAKVTAMQKQLEKVNTTLDGRTNSYRDLRLRQDVLDAVGKKAQIRKGAQADVLGRASQVFKLDENDQLVAYDGEGKPIYGKGTDPLTLDEWTGQLIESAGHLFLAPKGGGASGNTRPAGDGKTKLVNPSAEEFGRHMEGIAKGDVVVVNE